MPAAELAAWRALPDLGALFRELWAMAEAWDPTTRHDGASIPAAEQARLQAATRENEASAALHRFLDVLEAPWAAAPEGTSREQVGLVMAAMRVIDAAFLQIHPRSLLVPAGFIGPATPAWLEDLAEERLITGCYGASGTVALIPRGPLGRAARRPSAAYGDTLADQFAALAVAPRVSSHDGRAIQLNLTAIGPDAARGVPSVGAAGSERVGFIPVAEAATDLELVDHEKDGRFYLDVRPVAPADLADRLLAGLRSLGAADMALSPELTMPEAAADRLCAALAAEGAPLPRVILAGSGETEATYRGRAWNEARLINANGATLMRQRKIWPFGMARQRAADFRLVDPGKDGLLMENVASGDTLTVVDLPDLGRCLVLICQDFKIPPLVADVLRTYQPDWVLTPVLDVDIADHGWCRQRAFALSESSQARFMIVNSLSLGRLLAKPDDSPLGMALGPLESADVADASRVTTTVHPTATGPVRGELTWRSSGWTTTTIGSKPIR